jgi:hypothetical protein
VCWELEYHNVDHHLFDRMPEQRTVLLPLLGHTFLTAILYFITDESALPSSPTPAHWPVATEVRPTFLTPLLRPGL